MGGDTMVINLIESKKMKNKIAEKIAYLLPYRVMYFVVIRMWAYTTSHECANKTPDQTTWNDVLDSWSKKTGVKI